MTAVSSITVNPGGAAVHVTVTTGGGSALAPGNIAWNLDPVLQPLSLLADGTGFNFQAPVGMPDGFGNAVATDTLGGNGVATLVVVVSTPALGFTTP